MQCRTRTRPAQAHIFISANDDFAAAKTVGPTTARTRPDECDFTHPPIRRCPQSDATTRNNHCLFFRRWHLQSPGRVLLRLSRPRAFLPDWLPTKKSTQFISHISAAWPDVSRPSSKNFKARKNWLCLAKSSPPVCKSSASGTLTDNVFMSLVCTIFRLEQDRSMAKQALVQQQLHFRPVRAGCPARPR